MIADVLTFKGFRGWTCGDTADTLTWNEAEAGRPAPSAAELLAWEAEHVASKNANAARLAADEADTAEAKVDAQVQMFLNFSLAQLDTWVDTNITGAGNKTAFKVLGRLAQAAARGRVLR